MSTPTWLSPARDRALRDGLRDLPELGALAATALPGERLGSEGKARSVPGSRPPVNLAVIDLTRHRKPTHDPTQPLRAQGPVWFDSRGRPHADTGLTGGILSTLADWTRLAEGELLDAGQIEPGTLADQPTVDSECAWLLRHVVWITEQQWCTELADDVRQMVADCRQVLRIRPEYQPRCLSEGCRAELEQHVGWWECPACKRDYRDERMVLALQQPMTAEQIAKSGIADVTASTIRTWRDRGHLAPAVDGPLPRYHVLDVLRLADNKGSRHA